MSISDKRKEEIIEEENIRMEARKTFLKGHCDCNEGSCNCGKHSKVGRCCNSRAKCIFGLLLVAGVVFAVAKGIYCCVV